jgi:hypothetical protein
MRYALLTFNVAFWLAVAYLPLAISQEVTDFMVNTCMVGSECLNYAMPLIIQIGLVDWAARILLWPLVAWHLGGHWLWQHFRHGTCQQSGSSPNA